jgi:hypothetical protein
MATNLTYDSLVEDLKAYLDRGIAAGTPAEANIPRRINDAERAIIADLKLQGYEHTIRGFLAAGTAIYDKPDRLRRILGIQIVVSSKRRGVLGRAYEFVRSYWPDETLQGVPKYYSEVDAERILIAPTPDDAYPIEIKGYFTPLLLGPENQTNFMTEFLPNPLRYRALKEMALYLKKYDQATIFGNEYKDALAALGQEDIQKIKDRAAERDTP